MKTVLLTIFLFCASPLWATKYYVNKSGSDSNSCATAQSATDANAKLTGNGASGAFSCMSSGDTVEFGAGVYTEGWEGTTNFPVPSGSMGSPSIVQVESGANVTINGYSLDNYVVYVWNRNYITFDGFIFDGQNDERPAIIGIGAGTSGGTDLSHHIIFKNFTCTNLGGTDGVATGGCITTVNGPSDGTNSSHDITIQDCVISGVHGGRLVHGIYWGLQDSTITDCTISDVQAMGIHLFRTSGNVANNNTFANLFISGTGSYGFMFSSGSGNLAKNLIISGTGIRASLYGTTAGGLRFYGGSSSNTAANITIYGVTGNGIHLDTSGGTVTGSIIRNVISYNSSVSNYLDDGASSTTEDHNSRSGTDPHFVNAAGGNFHLTSSSTTALDAGTTVASVTDDYDGVTRPQGSAYDIGAFEYQTAPAGAVINIFESKVVR